MLAFFEYSDNLEEQYFDSKTIAKKIHSKYKDFFTEKKIAREIDLIKEFKDKIIFIEEGIFKLFRNEKLIRLFSEEDIIVTKKNSEFKLNSEFSTTISYIDYQNFLEIISKSAEFLEKFIEYQFIEKKISYSLLEESISDIYQPPFNIQQFKKGDYIIRKNEDSDKIYHLLSGIVDIYIDETKLGEIYHDEIFGEFSFFTESKRTADAVAKTKVLVNVIKRKDFAKIVKTKPEISLKIGKTLSKRIIRLNKLIKENES